MFSQLRYVQEQLGRLSLKELPAVAKGSDVPLSTVKKIFYKITPTPRSDTADKLAAYFRVKEKRKAA